RRTGATAGRTGGQSSSGDERADGDPVEDGGRPPPPLPRTTRWSRHRALDAVVHPQGFTLTGASCPPGGRRGKKDDTAGQAACSGGRAAVAQQHRFKRQRHSCQSVFFRFAAVCFETRQQSG
ncbi:Protein RETICULATA-RELATED 2, chloroplastic, partial [Frankliniella fusca]